MLGQDRRIYKNSCDVEHINADTFTSFEPKVSKNRITTSFFKNLDAEIHPCGFGLKYAAQGQELYNLGGKNFSVSNSKYLLVNESVHTIEVAIKDTPTWSVCVDMDEVLVNDLLLAHLQPNELDSYHDISRFLLTPELFIRETEATDSLKAYLKQIITSSAAQELDNPGIELIYELITHIVAGNRERIKSYYQLPTVKVSTRKELFQRLLLGKQVLEDNLFSPVTVSQVADACCMSEFRFYRLFRLCFGASPYNYLFKKRIEKSLELRKQGLSWVEIATLLNFTDLAAFSKAFKKVMGLPPSKVLLA